MTKIIGLDPVICTNCRSILQFDSSDIRIETKSYVDSQDAFNPFRTVYYEVRYITCPKCNTKISLGLVNK